MRGPLKTIGGVSAVDLAYSAEISDYQHEFLLFMQKNPCLIVTKGLKFRESIRNRKTTLEGSMSLIAENPAHYRVDSFEPVIMPAINWHGEAACRGSNYHIFFPPTQTEGRRERRKRETLAKDVCAECSVQKSCLQYALSIEETHGIWGGLTSRERRALAVN